MKTEATEKGEDTMKKKLVSLTLAAAMAVGLLAGCGSSSSTTSTASSEATEVTEDTAASTGAATETTASGDGYKIGVNVFGSSSYALLTLAGNSEKTFQAYGDNVSVMDDNFQVDKIIQDIENMISSGVDGLAVWLPADNLYETVSQKCEEAQIPFVLVDKVPSDESIKESLLENPYFVGAVAPANADYGTQMAEYALDQGWTTCITSSSTLGDPTDQPRLDAFAEVFEAGGGTIVAELHSDSSDKIQPDLEDALQAHPDVDFVYGTGSDFGNGAVAAKENCGLDDLPVLTSGLDSQAVDYLAEGKITLLTGDNWEAGILSSIILQNYLEGNQLLDADGNVPYIEDIQPFSITPEQCDLFKDVFINNFCYSSEELQSYVGSDFTYDDLIALDTNFSFAERANALADAGVISADDVEAANLE